MSDPQTPIIIPKQHSETFYGPTIICFILLSLLSGSLLREVNKKFGIPYSPMLMFLGVMLGVYHQSLGGYGQSAWLIEQIHPHTGLQIFVPTLMFTGALGVNYHMLKKSLVNILILTIPGVLIGALAMGFIIKSVLGYTDDQLTWYQAITLGCALSSTDPVAVSTLLKQMGSNARFNTLLDGQSLINGGVSMVLYTLFLDLANGTTTTALGFTVDLVRFSVGGCLLGLVFGVIVSYWLKKIIRDQTLSVVITVIGSYLSFYLSEFTWLRLCGVVAVVVQGIYLAGVVKRKIYPESQQALDTVWSTLAYCAQTIVFILGGVIMGIQFQKYHTITSDDWIKMLSFWVLMIIVRAIIIYAFYPVLKSRGYGLSKQELVVLIYGGLKGALGLSLAMMITVDDYYPTRFRQLVTFYMAGMVVMTVLINGLTCKKVLDYVQMIHVPEIKLKLFKRCVKQVLNNTRSKLEQLKSEPDLVYANWKQVQNLADIHKLGEVQRERQQQAREVQLRDSLVDVNQKDMVEQIRFRFTRYLRKQYWKFYGGGEVSEEAIRMLSQNCDVVNDNVMERLNYFDLLNGALNLQSVKIFMYFKDWALIGQYFTRMLVSRIYFVYEISLIFVEASQETIRTFKNDFPLNNQHLGYVLSQVKDNIDQAASYINDLQSNFPEVIQAVHTRRAATILLKNKKNNLKNMFEQGFIDNLQYESLRKEIDVGLVNAQFSQYKLEQIRINQALFDCPLFSALSKSQINSIRRKATQKVFQKDEKIIVAQTEIKAVYILLTGTVKQQFQNFYLIKSTGNVINPYDITLRKDSSCNAIALDTVKVMQINHEIVQDLIATNVEFKKKWFKSVFLYETYFNKNLEFLHLSMSEKQFRRFIEASEIKVMKAGEKDFTQQGGCYLFDGQLESQGTTYSKGASIIPKEKMIKALTDSAIIKFKQIVNSQHFIQIPRVSKMQEKQQ